MSTNAQIVKYAIDSARCGDQTSTREWLEMLAKRRPGTAFYVRAWFAVNDAANGRGARSAFFHYRVSESLAKSSAQYRNRCRELFGRYPVIGMTDAQEAAVYA